MSEPRRASVLMLCLAALVTGFICFICQVLPYVVALFASFALGGLGTIVVIHAAYCWQGGGSELEALPSES